MYLLGWFLFSDAAFKAVDGISQGSEGTKERESGESIEKN